MIIALDQPLAQLIAIGAKTRIAMPYPVTTESPVGIKSNTTLVPSQKTLFNNDQVKLQLAIKGFTSFDKLCFGKEVCRVRVIKCEENNPGANLLSSASTIDKLFDQDPTINKWIWTVEVVK